jgi:hypothetical protein
VPRFFARRVACALLLATVGGCARVKPWEREKHGARVMQTAPAPAEQKLDGHVEEYREGSIGGTGVGGGGCGCN